MFPGGDFLSSYINHTKTNFLKYNCIRVKPNYPGQQRLRADEFSTDADSALFTGIYYGALALYGDPGARGGIEIAAENLTDKYMNLGRLVESMNVVNSGRGIKGNTWGDYVAAGKISAIASAPDSETNEMLAVVMDTTRDQLTGMLFGLVMNGTPDIAKKICQKIVDNDYKLLRSDGTHAKSAYKLDAALKEIVDTILNPIPTIVASRVFPKNLCASTFHYNKWPTRRFVWHLRLLQAATLSKLGYNVNAWVDRCMKFVGDDGNPMFEALAFLAKRNDNRPVMFNKERVVFSDKALEHLHASMDNEYTGYFRWEKHPNEWWDIKEYKIGPGMDYWVPLAIGGYNG